ncbi:hypothetical protein OESDEN_23994 [Oesophagostomum dentatum]|uniref:Class II aldolase/adducin N-terminal domain-containing protein n=1 Tax=Oesophagostomum dentatum TaxID=61180 RepID=A0A0B1RXM2_OESDE|nr:hypothetical protein OESDEN_23994 [Oesophagostomum dentatum]
MFPNGVQNGSCVPNFEKPHRKPVNDLHPGQFSPEEARLRCQLASLYRLVDLFQWSQGVFNHITVRVPGDDTEILINPFGLLYHEQTASTLVKVDLEGKVLHPGSTKLGINQVGLYWKFLQIQAFYSLFAQKGCSESAVRFWMT